jgi:hypothetical protein
MSLQLVLAGLFPPKNTALEWNKKLNWQPIPFNYQELDDDSLLLVRRSCPRFYEELERVFKEDLKLEMNKNVWLFKELSNITGWKIDTPDDIQSLYSTLKAEESFKNSQTVSRKLILVFPTERIWSRFTRLDTKVLSSKTTRGHRKKLYL